MHAAAGRRHAGIFSYAATPKPLKSAWLKNLKNFKKKFLNKKIRKKNNFKAKYEN